MCILGDEIWVAQCKPGAVYDLATGNEKFRFRLPNYQACQTHAATPNYFILKKVFIPLKGAQADSPYGVRYYLNRSIQGTCAEKCSPSYGSVYTLAAPCVCEAFLPANNALYALPPTQPAKDELRLRRGSIAGLGPLARQSEATASVDALAGRLGAREHQHRLCARRLGEARRQAPAAGQGLS